MRSIILFVLGVFFVSTSLRAYGDFFTKLPPQDFAAAGLDKLSPEERQHLATLIEAYKKDAFAEGRKVEKAAVIAAQAAAPKPTNPQLASNSSSANSTGHSLGFLEKAKVLLKPGTQVEYEPIKSTIVGRFEGWESNTVFFLANGQRWQVVNGGSYFTPPKKDMEVEITPATLGGFWMDFPSLSTRVKVKLLSER